MKGSSTTKKGIKFIEILKDMKQVKWTTIERICRLEK